MTYQLAFTLLQMMIRKKEVHRIAQAAKRRRMPGRVMTALILEMNQAL
ncbi:hypothetical protein SBDP1_100051 [Syntrophobacter sp. SbD1]|nr:hypothetical protein SBDP1_100051 [Syntrophobacter sp. SbD1]